MTGAKPALPHSDCLKPRRDRYTLAAGLARHRRRLIQLTHRMPFSRDLHDRSTARWFAGGLAVLSLIAMIVTAWIWIYLRREQELVAGLVKHLPASDMAAVRELSGDLRLQAGLTILLVVNLIATAIALSLVVRGYMNSERSLRDVRVLSADILASMDAAVITTDRDGILTSTNPRGYDLIDIPDDGIGRPLSDLPDEHQLMATIRDEVAVTHQSVRDRDYVVQRQGHGRTLRAGCTLLRDQGGQEIGTVLHVRDVTQKAMMEDQLRRMERYMGLGSLAAGLQHEIKNPLSAAFTSRSTPLRTTGRIRPRRYRNAVRVAKRGHADQRRAGWLSIVRGANAYQSRPHRCLRDDSEAGTIAASASRFRRRQD